MPTCPDCGAPLGQVTEGAPPVCRACVMRGLMSEPPPGGTAKEDDFEILNEIGRGGDGTVYLARDKRVDRLVALKLINTFRAVDQDIEERFQAEADAIASLDHPHVIPIFSTGEIEGRPFYAMKYLSGGNLADRMADFSKPGDAAGLITQVARGLFHAHERGVLHRDLKPSNILLDPEGEPCISDFGLAKRPGQSINLTLTGAVMGTPAYMSPEQARGETSGITTATDIFSLGSILYQLLTGNPAFPGDNPHAIIRNVVEKEITFTRDEIRRLDHDLETICLKCLQKDPAQRYSSARALAEDLEAWSRGEPVSARRISTRERITRWIRKNPLPTVALTLALTSIIAGSIVSLNLWKRAESAREQAESDAYFSNVANALAAREEGDFGEAQRLLKSAPEHLRGMEWHLVKNLSRGDQLWTNRCTSTPKLLVLRGTQPTLLTEDRTLHAIDTESGNHTRIGELPATGRSDITKLAFSPDQKHLAMIEGNRLFIIDTETLALVGQDKINPADTLHWLTNDRIIFADKNKFPWSKEITAWEFDLTSSTALPANGWAGPFATSPDGKYLALARHNDHVVFLESGAGYEGEHLFFAQGYHTLHELAFSHDSKYILLLGGIDERELIIYEISTKEVIFRQFWPSQATMTVSPNSHEVFLAGSEPWITRWRYLQKLDPNPTFDDLTSHREFIDRKGPFSPPKNLRTRSASHGRTKFFLGHEAPATALLALPDGSGLLSISNDETLRHWGFQERQKISRNFGSYDSWHPSASLNGQYLLYGYHLGGEGVEPRVFDRNTETFTSYPITRHGLAVLNDGTVLTREGDEIICSNASDELWRIKAPPLPPEITEAVSSAVSADEQFVAVLYRGSALRIDLRAKSLTSTNCEKMTPGITPGYDIAITPDGETIALTGFSSKQPQLFQSGELIDIEGSSKASCCSFSPDGVRLIVGHDDGWIRVYDTGSRKELPDLSWQAHSTPVTEVALSPNGQTLSTAGGRNIIFWNLANSTRKLRFNSGTIPCHFLQFTQDNALFFYSAPNYPIEALKIK